MEDASGFQALCQEIASVASVMEMSAESLEKVGKGKQKPSAQVSPPMLDFFVLYTEALAALYKARRRQTLEGPVTDVVLKTGKA